MAKQLSFSGPVPARHSHADAIATAGKTWLGIFREFSDTVVFQNCIGSRKRLILTFL